MDSLVANNLMMIKSKSMDKICQAHALNTFKGIREDMDKLVYSSYLSEIVANFGVDENPSSEEIYELLYKALNRISSANDKKDVLIAVIKFQLKFMLIEGFALEFDTYLCCREQILDEDMYISLQMGGVLCKECNETFKANLKLNHKVRDFFQAMLQFDFDYESDYDRKATEKVLDVCFNLLNKHIQSHSTKTFKSLKTLQSVGV